MYGSAMVGLLFMFTSQYMWQVRAYHNRIERVYERPGLQVLLRRLKLEHLDIMKAERQVCIWVFRSGCLLLFDNLECFCSQALIMSEEKLGPKKKFLVKYVFFHCDIWVSCL